MQASPASKSAKKLKVRTGCITCKIRKVKCDEIKPFCKRCTDTGRKCDGYLDLERVEKGSRSRSTIAQTKRSIAIADFIPYISTPYQINGLSTEECQWLRYFNLRTGPALSAIADRSFWSQVLPQMSLTEPAIRHALLAVGSFHAQFEAKATRRRDLKAIDRDFTIKHYNLAIMSLNSLHYGGSANAEVSLVCCLLFTCLECLYGNRLLVLDHLRNGRNILDSEHFQDTSLKCVSSVRDNLHQIFLRLEGQSTFFGKSATPGFENLVPASKAEVSSFFADITEAKRSLDTLLFLTLNFTRATSDGTFTHDSRGRSVLSYQSHLQEQFLTWKRSFDHLEGRSAYKDTEWSNLSRVLCAQHRACSIYLSNYLELEQSSYDAYMADFAEIVRLARPLFQTRTKLSRSESSATCSAASCSSPISNFTLDPGLIPTLFLVAVKCRDPVIRREAISLLETNPRLEGLWNSKLQGRVARRIMEIEEAFLIASQNSKEACTKRDYSTFLQNAYDIPNTSLPEDKHRVYRADIEGYSEDNSGQLSVTFFTAPNGALGGWNVWVEELWY